MNPEAFLAKPFLERVQTLALNWVDNGYGVPRMVHAIYIVKLVFFYAEVTTAFGRDLIPELDRGL